MPFDERSKLRESFGDVIVNTAATFETPRASDLASDAERVVSVITLVVVANFRGDCVTVFAFRVRLRELFDLLLRQC